MKYRLSAVLAASLLALTLSASAREMVLPAGTLLKCTMNEPNFSSATVSVGDPVLCHLHSVTEFGQQAFPRGSYLVGHLEAAKEPGHFWGKGSLKLQFDRIGMPQGDMPLDAKVISTRGYKVNKQGDIRGKGHPTRDVVEWMLPPLWPWKIITLPARGPRPKLNGEAQLTLRLMDDVQIPQVQANNGPSWHFFGRGRVENESFYKDSSSSSYGLSNRSVYNASSGNNVAPQLAVRQVSDSDAPVAQEVSQVTYASYVSKAARPSAAPGMPVFVLKTGMVLSVANYTYQDGRLSYELASGGNGVISADEIDWSTTTNLNHKRGIRVSLRSGHQNAGPAGY
jgi:hypothetical protein